MYMCWEGPLNSSISAVLAFLSVFSGGGVVWFNHMCRKARWGSAWIWLPFLHPLCGRCAFHHRLSWTRRDGLQPRIKGLWQVSLNVWMHMYTLVYACLFLCILCGESVCVSVCLCVCVFLCGILTLMHIITGSTRSNQPHVSPPVWQFSCRLHWNTFSTFGGALYGEIWLQVELAMRQKI